MASILQVNINVRSSFYFDGVFDGVHLFPLAVEFVLIFVLRIQLIDTQILSVDGEDGEPPGSVIIVTNGYTGDGGFAPAQHIPTRRIQVNHVAKRRYRNAAMRIAGQQRGSVGRKFSTDHPVVAPDVLIFRIHQLPKVIFILLRKLFK